ncbi:MAG: Uma2 family endonuclease [Isosphaeraceae bacterium]
MASMPRIHKGLTLEEFLKLPDIEEPPCLEYIDGRIERKAVAQTKHIVIQSRLNERLDQFARPSQLGESFPELRCTFAGRSIVPDIVFFLEDHIELDDQDEYANVVRRPPDIHVEIISPDQSVAKTHRKLLWSVTNGCPLGVLIHPERKTINVYRPNQEPERLAPDGAIHGEPVLPGFRLPVAEVFGWLVRRKPNPPASGVDPA